MRIPALATVALLLAACQPAAETPPPADAPVPVESNGSAGDAPAAAPAAPDPALTAFLQDRTRDAMAPLSYVSAETGQGADALTLVQFIGPEFCGSGGCNLLILAREGDAYAVLGDVSLTRPPIRLLSTRSNGRPDIGVHVSGGGLPEGYEARLAFDGTRYPSNPSVSPAERVDGADGLVLITDDSPRTTLKP